MRGLMAVLIVFGIYFEAHARIGDEELAPKPKCPETLPVDLYMRCIERQGLFPRRLSQEFKPSHYMKAKLAATTKCDAKATDEKRRPLVSLISQPQSLQPPSDLARGHIINFGRMKKSIHPAVHFNILGVGPLGPLHAESGGRSGTSRPSRTCKDT